MFTSGKVLVFCSDRAIFEFYKEILRIDIIGDGISYTACLLIFVKKEVTVFEVQNTLILFIFFSE